MTPGRKLVYDFLNLPHYRQLNIIIENGLVSEAEVQTTMDEIELFKLAFQRVKEQNKFEAVRHAVENAMIELGR